MAMHRTSLLCVLLLASACGDGTDLQASSDEEPTADDEATTADPSGEAPPGNSTTWTRTFVDEFLGTSVDTTRWTLYNGTPNNGIGHWDPSHATVQGGVVTLDTYKDASGKWVSAGMSNKKSFTQTYGMFLVRMKFAPGFGVKGVALLWPSNGTWPPEVDFMETSPADGAHAKNKMTNHYSPGNQMQHASYAVDLTAWHTLGVIWSASSLEYTVDGNVVATMTGHVPNIGMHLAMQSNIGACSLGCPNASTPAHVPLVFDWVAAYRHN